MGILGRFRTTAHWLQRRFSSSLGASTIYALSSGQGKCGVAVIRVSGSQASAAILKMTQCKELPPPRLAALQRLFDPDTGIELDRGLLLWFPGPRSFTGEDSCEFQVHGGPAVVQALLQALSKLQNFRPAEAGEFTRRAFHAGKLDLTQVEGLADLIHAETEYQRRQALVQMEGRLGAVCAKWRDQLLKSVAHVEAYIDFSEDENIEDNVLDLAVSSLRDLKGDLETHLADGRRGERLRGGVRTVILGEPNVGKSSLLNALCQRPAAIVTPIEGTTRDIVELQLNISGYPLILADTAGLRKQTQDVVEKEGIARAYAYAKTADLILIVLDAKKCFKHITKSTNGLWEYVKQYKNNLGLDEVLDESKRSVTVLNKVDLLDEAERECLLRVTGGCASVRCLSCISEEGFSVLIQVLTEQLKTLCGNPSSENPSLTQARHRFHLSECSKSIEMALTLSKEEDIPLVAHHLRSALRHLGKLTGQVSSEEILDVIFKDFCVGK